MAASSKSNARSVREALTAGTNVKEKGPPVADGILSVTPDTPEVVEWRSRSALDAAETTSTYLNDENDEDGPKPHELYGKFTWKIENFSEISKRELRSNIFDVGNYKWYILVYPQGCDVCNHLSLFLCVADYDKLLPGWSHFAQFTIAVVNKDPKKSKYSDTLHRFCKKEHDWGWKKFMELSKVLDGFTVADTLVIKAQVQVILDKPSKPFRCLDPQYRRELVRVYLTNVEGVCRRFCDDKRARLLWAKDEAGKFRDFWCGLAPEQQRKLLTERGEVILKGVVKQFFNEKEVTSTLVMDALYSGCKQLEEHSRQYMAGKSPEGPPLVVIKADRNTLTLHGDIMEIADRATRDFIPAAKDDNKPSDGLALRSGQEDDYRRDTIERDEKRLAELGRKTVEMYVIAHVFAEKLEIAYREAEALRRQDLLILEEFEAQKAEDIKRREQAEKDKEKKAKKKERMKQKKEAEKAKKDAEEAERRRQEEVRRQEQERKAREAAAAEKKRLEEAAAAMQQQNAAKQAQARAEKAAAASARAVEQPRQAPAPTTSSQPEASRSAGPQPAAQRKQQAQPPVPQQASSRGEAARASPAQAAAAAAAPSSQAPAAARAPPSAQVAASGAHAHTHTHQDDSSSTASSTSSRADGGGSDSRGSQEVGTVRQARGGEPGSDSGDSGDSRAELEEEVAGLRERVRALEHALVERDTEIQILKHALELQTREAADAVAAKEEAMAAAASAQAQAQQQQAQLAATTSVSASSRHTSTSSIEKEVLSELIGQGQAGAPASAGDTGKAAAETANSSARPQEGGAPAPAAAAASARRGPSGPASTPFDTSRANANGPQARGGSAAGPHTQGAPAAASAAAGSGESSMMRAGSASLGPAGERQQAGYHPLGHTTAAAAAAAAAQANGRARASSIPADSAPQSKANPSTSAPYQLAQAAAAAAAAAAQANNTVPLAGDNLPPSYRNAAAGVMAGGQAPAASMPPVSPSAPHKMGEEGAAAGAGSTATAAAGGQGQARGHLNHVAPEFSNQRLMMHPQTAAAAAAQQAQQRGMGYSHVGGKGGAAAAPAQGGSTPAHRVQAAVPQDSPGLDDFAHMGLIDDLLGAE